MGGIVTMSLPEPPPWVEPVHAPSRKRRILHLLLLALVFVVGFSFGAVPIRASNDVWWHLKTGQYIAENGYRLPVVDPFNFMAEDAEIEWHNHEWLGQLGFWWVYQAGETLLGGSQRWDGLTALILSKAFLLGITYVALALLAGWISGAGLPGVVAALLAAEVGRRTFYPRPPVYSYLFLVLLYAFLHAVRVGKLRKRWLAAMLPFFCFWANIHGAWAAGGVVLAAFAVGAFIDSLSYHYRRTPLVNLPTALFNDSAPWFASGFLAILGTLGNPSGYHLYEMFSRVLSDKALVARIGELAPPTPAISTFFLLSIILIILLGMAVRRPFPWSAEYLIVPFFLWQALHHVRHLTLWGLLMAPAFAWLLAEAIRQAPKGVAGLARIALLGLTLLTCVYWVALNDENGTFMERNLALLRGESYVRDAFPADECDFLIDAAEQGLAGRLFNLDYYAGYLIWRLSPEPYQVISDSRFDIFGGQYQRLTDSLIVAPEGWDDYLEELNVNLALLPLNKMLTQAMRNHPDWELIYYRLRPVGQDADGRLVFDPQLSWTNGWAILARRSANSPELLSKLKQEAETQRRLRHEPDLNSF
jgi:hypothetical protein